MAESYKTEALAGWGRFQPAPCRVYRPERCDGLQALLDGAAPGPLLARGLGRSYGDTAVNRLGSVIDMTRLNRMRSFDPETGVLDCEAGVSLSEILEIFVPRGWRPPVLPGTRLVTVGGTAIHLRALFIVGTEKIQCHGSGKFTLTLFLRYFDVSRVELPVPIRLQNAEDITDNLLLPVDKLKRLVCPCTFGM